MFADVACLLAQACVPEPTAVALGLGRLVALRKPSGGTRGLVVGDFFRRLVARTLVQQFSAKIEQACRPHWAAADESRRRTAAWSSGKYNQLWVAWTPAPAGGGTRESRAPSPSGGIAGGGAVKDRGRAPISANPPTATGRQGDGQGARTMDGAKGAIRDTEKHAVFLVERGVATQAHPFWAPVPLGTVENRRPLHGPVW